MKSLSVTPKRKRKELFDCSVGRPQRNSAMGGKSSVLIPPWRTIEWSGDQQSELQYVKNYKPKTEGQQLRILLHGPCGAGKSSFINSVQSVLLGRIYAHALADNTSGKSFTKQYTTFKIKKDGQGSYYPFIFNDTMGMSEEGVQVKDIKLAFKGHIKEGYKFDSSEAIQKDNAFYNASPTPCDKVHILVYVIPAKNYLLFTEKIIRKIRDIRKEASTLKIPQVVILTKIDEAYPEIKKDLQTVYRLQSMKEMMEKISVDVGVPVNCIFPVKNYHEEISLDNDTNCLILSALKNIINFGDDCLDFTSYQPNVK